MSANNITADKAGKASSTLDKNGLTVTGEAVKSQSTVQE